MRGAIGYTDARIVSDEHLDQIFVHSQKVSYLPNSGLEPGVSPGKRSHGQLSQFLTRTTNSVRNLSPLLLKEANEGSFETAAAET